MQDVFSLLISMNRWCITWYGHELWRYGGKNVQSYQSPLHNFWPHFTGPHLKSYVPQGKIDPNQKGGGDVLAYLRAKSTKASTTSKQASSGLKKAKPHVPLSPNPLMDALDWLPPSIFITKSCIDIKIKICSLVSEKLQSWTKGLEKNFFMGEDFIWDLM